MYVKRTVKCGCVVEIRKMFPGRAGKKGTRGKNVGATDEAQQKKNERRAEENLRWKLNANFRAGDYHVVLHYGDKERTFEQCRSDLCKFLRELRKLCKAKNLPCRYIACTETKRMTNIHHHVVMTKIPLEVISQAWDTIEGTASVSLRPLDRRGNHAELASYLMKECRSTMKRYKEMGTRGKRFSCSRHLIMPVPEYETIEARAWSKEPKARKGSYLWKDKDGNTAFNFEDEETGKLQQVYFEIYLDRQDGHKWTEVCT